MITDWTTRYTLQARKQLNESVGAASTSLKIQQPKSKAAKHQELDPYVKIIERAVLFLPEEAQEALQEAVRANLTLIVASCRKECHFPKSSNVNQNTLGVLAFRAALAKVFFSLGAMVAPDSKVCPAIPGSHSALTTPLLKPLLPIICLPNPRPYAVPLLVNST